jgi:hypothetical protein
MFWYEKDNILCANKLCGQCGIMLGHRRYPSKSVGRITVLALTAVIAVALSLVLTCSAVDIPVMQPKLENATVDPGTSGKWAFTYAVNCTFSDKVNITLEIYNLSEHEWTTVSAKPYTNISKLETLTWDNVKLCSRECEGTSSYRFLYNDSIQITKLGPTIAAPSVTVVKLFKNATLNPTLGLWDDSYNYSVDVNVSEEASIRLDVYDVGSGRWKAAGSEVYTNKSGRLTWTNVTPFSFDSTGLASYRFVDQTHNHESGIYYGPILNVTGKEVIISGGGGGGGGVSRRRVLEILEEELGTIPSSFDEIKPPNYIYSDVDPKNGSWLDHFDYWIEFEHPNKADMWLTLVVYCPGDGKNHTVSTQEVWSYNKQNRTKVEWRDVNLFSKEDAEAKESPEYYIRYNDGCNKGFWGPYSGPKLYFPPVLTDPSVSPAEGTCNEQFEYKVNVTDEDGDDVNVTLYIFDSEGAEIYRNKTQVSGSELTTGKTVSWTYGEFTDKEVNKTLEYMFIASDGNASANISREGPHIMPDPPIEPLYPLDLILGFFLFAPLFVVLGLSCLHGRKVKRTLENAGFDVKEKRKNLQINDPNFYLVEISWIAAVTALLISSIFITLRAGLISSGIIILILSIVASILIIWALGRLPVLKCEYLPLKRCYQECSISKSDSYKKVAGVSFTIASVSIIFAFGGYVIPYYHDPILIGGINFWSFYLYIVASILFAVCIFLLLSPMLSEWWKWRKKCF